MHIGLFCFRRDLRLHDNLALCKLSKTCNVILPVFCLDPRQLHASQNPYYSPHSVKFMFESLIDLDQQIRKHQSLQKRTDDARLVIASGQPDTCLPQLVDCLLHQKRVSRVSVAWNEDNTPFSMHRDKLTIKALRDAFDSKVCVVSDADDVTIVPVRNVRTNTGGKYQMFTPFYRKTLASGVAKPQTLTKAQFLTLPSTARKCKCKLMKTSNLFKGNIVPPLCSLTTCVKGGRKEGLRRLGKQYIMQRCDNYNKERDHTWEEKTTRLSAYFKFGCVSFREAYYSVCRTLQTEHPVACEALTREFFWNAFYAYVSYCFPHVLRGQLTQSNVKKTRKQSNVRGKNLEMLPRLQGKLDNTWNTNPKQLQCWKDGMTGFPYIDAAMRQLLTTGWMHNRARMVVASFLVKDLRVDWREGEQHFAQHLVDYDPSANNGGWQWAASTGADAMQYTRIFNPWTQSKKFDPHAVYIKTYVKELSDPKIPANDIHKWHDHRIRDAYEHHPTASTYPSPIVDHSQARKETLGVWKAL